MLQNFEKVSVLQDGQKGMPLPFHSAPRITVIRSA